MKYKVPNLFLIGSPKCATTSLAKYLSEQPDISFSHPKEPNYFNKDFNSKHRRFFNDQEYLSTCFHDYNGEPYAAEGTVWYLYSKIAITEILKFNSAAKFIVIIREPAEMLYSLHSTLLKSAQENIQSFQTAWNETLINGENRDIPWTCRDKKLLMYHKIGRQGSHIKRLFNEADISNILILSFKEITENFNLANNKLEKFLKVEFTQQEKLNKSNSNAKVRSQFISYLLGEFGRNNVLYNLKRKFGFKSGSFLIKPLQNINLVTKDRPQLDNSLRTEINEYFSADKEILKRHVGKNNVYW